MKVVVTGGAGFIGSNLIRYLITNTGHEVVIVDKLTYAGHLSSLPDLQSNPRLSFERVDIFNAIAVKQLFTEHKPDWLMHLAAESHVDRSINEPDAFIKTNIVGTYNLLHSARHYFDNMEASRKSRFRFHHISTDEVYGSLEIDDEPFTEASHYNPSSPYSASKAAADHLVRAWYATYGLPVIVSNCSNNYGPRQLPEKLIPLVITRALSGSPIPLFGSGENIRDWVYVTDHIEALYAIICRGRIGESYNVGGRNQLTNIEIVELICELLDQAMPMSKNTNIKRNQRNDSTRYADLIEFVPDRPGHDLRYDVDTCKISQELAWTPKVTLNQGLQETVRWYLENKDWWQPLMDRK